MTVFHRPVGERAREVGAHASPANNSSRAGEPPPGVAQRLVVYLFVTVAACRGTALAQLRTDQIGSVTKMRLEVGGKAFFPTQYPLNKHTLYYKAARNPRASIGAFPKNFDFVGSCHQTPPSLALRRGLIVSYMYFSSLPHHSTTLGRGRVQSSCSSSAGLVPFKLIQASPAPGLLSLPATIAVCFFRSAPAAFNRLAPGPRSDRIASVTRTASKSREIPFSRPSTP